MKSAYIFLFFIAAFATLFGSENQEIIPKLQGVSMGYEFYFSFIPTWDKGEAELLKIYITSGVRTKVTVKIEGRDYEKIKYTVPNDFIENSIPAEIGQVYTKSEQELPKPDSVWENMGIRITSNDPIACYALTRHKNSSDGFVIQSVTNLGKEYIISSFADHGDNTTEWYPGYVAITAAYDKTKVKFFMGGNENSRTTGGLTPGDSGQWNMHAGDVLLIASEGYGSDLTGSRVSATKPVSVVSGNFCAEVPIGASPCNIVQSMELPIHTWGKEYLVPNIIKRKKNSILKIFAKEPNTKIFLDNNTIGYIKNSGGTEGDGYFSIRAETEQIKPIVISADKEISVTQYNTSSSDDESMSHPFMLTLTPFEQFSKEVAFPTPGIRGGYGFLENYVNICYEPTEFGTIPYDLEFATVEAGVYAWIKIVNISPNPGTPFIKLSNGKQYYSKNLLLPGDGIYRIRSEKPFSAYVYGNSLSTSYGFPALYPPIDDNPIVDTLPPITEYTTNCGDIVGILYDQYDSLGNSGLSTIYIHSDLSYNYHLRHDEFMPCEDDSVNWSLEIINCSEDAQAVMTFMDCRGNSTDTVIYFNAPDVFVRPRVINMKSVELNESIDSLIRVISLDNKAPYKFYDVKFKKGNQGFELLDSNKKKITFPIIIYPNDTTFFFVRFQTSEHGMFKDSIIFSDSCCSDWKTFVTATTVGFENDKKPPVINYLKDCARFRGNVVDSINVEGNSGISIIYTQSDISYNFKLRVDNYIPCENDSVSWSLDVIDCKEDALVNLAVSDCAGNQTNTIIEYFAPKLSYLPQSVLFKELQIDSESDTTLWIYNKAEKAKLEINQINLLLGNSGFSVFDKDFNTIALPFVIEPMDSVMLNLRYSADSDGRFRDTLLIVDTCCFNERIPLEAYTTGTGVNDLFGKEINLYPNPAEDLLHIENIPRDITEILIFDVFGREVKNIYLPKSDILSIPISEFPSGVYYLRMIRSNKPINFKFLVMH